MMTFHKLVPRREAQRCAKKFELRDLLSIVVVVEECDLAPLTACAKAIAVAQATRRRSARDDDKNTEAVHKKSLFLLATHHSPLTSLTFAAHGYRFTSR
jgi:hypothetical protein